MLTLILHSALYRGPSAPLDLEKDVLLFGRASECDLKLRDPSISLRHATLRQEGEDFILTDEGSSNGTYVGEVRLEPRRPYRLAEGELVRMGSIWLEVRTGDVVLKDDPPTTKREALALHHDDGDDDDPTIVTQLLLALRVKGGPNDGHVVCLAEAEGSCLIGRDGTPRCDLPLDDIAVSREHARVTWKRGGPVFVSDLASRNGTWMRGARLGSQQATQWPVWEEILVGNTRIELVTASG
jgi:pSer/pThr/pTyr-binding forkhead associated (FHA) protein